MLESMRTIIKEVYCNIPRVWRLTLYEKRARNSESKLGNLWEILNPVLNILVYWFVFSVGLRTSAPHHATYPYVTWLVCGLFPWMTISNAMSQSTACYLSAPSIITTCNVPLSLFPLKTVTHALLNHLFTLAVMIVTVLLYGVTPTWHVVEVVYYTAAMALFLFGFALVTSTISVFFNDIQKLLPPTLRLLMYASCVVLDVGAFPAKIQQILRLNPLIHLIDGFRFCLLDGKGIVTVPETFFSFWIVTIVLLVAGSIMHVRLRERFIDAL